jgi:TolA-binding protein
MEKLRGYSTLLRVRLESERRNWAEAVKQAEALLRVNPSTAHAGALLFVEARAQKALGRMDLAAECLKLIVEKYPECEEAAEARKALEKLPPGKGPAPGGKQ